MWSRAIATLLLVSAASVVARDHVAAFHSELNGASVLRRCQGTLYVSPMSIWGKIDRTWFLTSPLDTAQASDATAISIKSPEYPVKYLCWDGVSTLKLFAAADGNVTQCTFNKVAGLANAAHFSLKQGNKYVTMLSTLSGPCSASSYGCTNSVGLVENPNATLATWDINEPTLVFSPGNTSIYGWVQPCSFHNGPSDIWSAKFWSNSALWVLETGLDGSNDAVSVRLNQVGSSIYMANDNGAFRALHCAGRESDCSFHMISSVPGNVYLEHKASGTRSKLVRTSPHLPLPCSVSTTNAYPLHFANGDVTDYYFDVRKDVAVVAASD
eukprot:m51a1_g7449 hypothetical protein (326) ;mRNA; f:103677-104801